MSQQKKFNRDSRFCGLVRAVPSGDTLQILELADSRSSATLKEINLTLQGLKAPTFGRKTVKDGKVQVEKDQDWAFESREFLRRLVIGKCIVYRVEHEAGDRAYGEVWLNDENLRFKIVKEGWADVPPRAPRKGKDGNDLEPSEDYLELVELKESAENLGIGKWQKDSKKCRRSIYRDVVRGGRGEDELFAFFEKNRDKPLPGVVEQVRSGSTLRVLLTKTMDNVPLLLSGIRCPTYKFNDDAGCEPFSREAKFITEHYLLHRNVTVTIEGFDNFNNYYGTVVDSEGRNVCQVLLQMGLATYVEWMAPKASAVQKQFREAERDAQDKKLRLWSAKPQQAPAPKAGASKTKPDGNSAPEGRETLTGKVVEIVNAGTITVRVEKEGRAPVERKLNLSSVVVPRLLTKREEDALTKKRAKLTDPAEIQSAKEEELEAKLQSAYAAEAKELLRSKLIGEDVKCEFDYLRSSFTPKDSQANLPPKQFWSIYYKGQNIAVELVQHGFAKVVRHSADEPRSRNYQDLIIAEKTAQKAAKGIFGPKSSLPVVHKNDLTELSQDDDDEGDKKSKKTPPNSRSMQFLPSLKRAGKLNAVVEYVFSGGRYKLFVPSQSVVLFFSLAGVATPRAPASGAKKEDEEADAVYGTQALQLAREKVFQRSVEVHIYNVDKGGNFLGQLIVNKQDFGLKLVEEGLARVSSRSLDSLSNKNDYKRLQEKAQKSRLNLWKDWDEEAEKAKQAAREQERKARNESTEHKSPDRFQIAVTEIIDGSTFCYQIIGEETKALSEMMNQFQNVDWTSLEPYTPKVGEVVSAQFSHDSNWYRAQISKVHSNSYDVVYIDYGNSESVTHDKVRKLLTEFDERIVPRQAKTGKLAYIITPKLADDFGKDAAEFFKALVWGKTLSATLYTDNYTNTTSLVVGDPETNVTVNMALVSAGLAQTEKRRFGNQFFQGLKQEEEKARRDRLNLWQFGDIPDSDDEM